MGRKELVQILINVLFRKGVKVGDWKNLSHSSNGELDLRDRWMFRDYEVRV